jgi:hypothetical protein
MHTNKSHIIKHINKRVSLLPVLLCKILYANVKAQANKTISSEYLGKQGTPLTDNNFDADKIDSDMAVVNFEKGAGKYGFDTNNFNINPIKMGIKTHFIKKSKKYLAFMNLY